MKLEDLVVAVKGKVLVKIGDEGHIEIWLQDNDGNDLKNLKSVYVNPGDAISIWGIAHHVNIDGMYQPELDLPPIEKRMIPEANLRRKMDIENNG